DPPASRRNFLPAWTICASASTRSRRRRRRPAKVRRPTLPIHPHRPSRNADIVQCDRHGTLACTHATKEQPPMKGIILAGGLGSRLRPLTLVTNKHLLPVYDRPMIYFPLEGLPRAGLNEILIVTGGEHAGDFLKLLKNGKQLGVKHLEYAYQEGEGGIADALKLAEDFADGDKVVVILGDNIIEKNIKHAVADFFT